MIHPITFPHTGPGEWTNRETGVVIRYNPDAGYQVWGRGLPTDGPVSGGTPSHRRSVGLGSEPHTYLHDALAVAKRYVADVARPAIEADGGAHEVGFVLDRGGATFVGPRPR